MIYSTIQRALDANVCEQGRIDSLAAMERDGLKVTDHINAVWCLDNCGVPGTLWMLRYVFPQHQAESVDALWTFVMVTATRHAGNTYSTAMGQLDNLARGHKQNLKPTRDRLRRVTTSEGNSTKDRAVSLMLYQALDEGAPLNVRAVQVCEQGMIAATHDEFSLISDSTQRYKAEYRLQFKQLRAILNGESLT